MIKLRDLLKEAPAQPAPARPGRDTEPDIKPGPATKPQPRRRSTPSPAKAPNPAPKAEKGKAQEKPHIAPKDGPEPRPANEGIMDKIVARYKKEFDKLHEVDYDKIFDPETVGKLKGSVSQRMQGKNPMQIAGNMQQLAMRVMQLERGNEDLLEQLAYDVVYETFPYLESNQDAIEIDAKIVPQAQVKDALKKDDEDEVCLKCMRQNEEEQMMADIEADLKKRRLINAITQGASTFSKSAPYVQQEYIDIIGGEGTTDKYRDLMQAALDMIDYMVSSGMAKQMGEDGLTNSSVGAESVFYDFEKEKWIIKARAVVFPVLILEIIKGMYEIIGLFGFNDLERGEKVVAKADKLTAEPEDIAYGQLIAKNLQDVINKLESNVSAEERDDFLQDIYKLDNDDFIKLMTNVINDRVSSEQMNMLKGMFSQMRSDKSADAADDALTERWARLAGLINENDQWGVELNVGDIITPNMLRSPVGKSNLKITEIKPYRKTQDWIAYIENEDTGEGSYYLIDWFNENYLDYKYRIVIPNKTY